MQLLETGLFDRYGFTSIGVAGHPEGSPDIPDAALKQALAWKNGFAERTAAQLYITTQFCFDAAPVIAWDKASTPMAINCPFISVCPVWRR